MLTLGILLVHLSDPAAVSLVCWHSDRASDLPECWVSSTPLGKRDPFLCRAQAENGLPVWVGRIMASKHTHVLILETCISYCKRYFTNIMEVRILRCFPGGSDGKESACNPGHLGLIPRLGRSPEGGHINPLQYSCLENLHGQRSLGGYSPWGCKEWDTSKRLSTANSSLTESGTLTAAKTKCQ